MNVKAGGADMEDIKKHATQNDSVSPASTGVGRRDMMKMGAGAMLASLGAKGVVAQEERPARTKGEDSNLEGVVRAASGWKNDANRLNGNGPMDETSRYIVNWVHSFSEAQL